MADTIQDALAAIPTAVNDQIIDASYHNSLRDAVRLLAGQTSQGAGDAILTVAPALLPTGVGPPWATSIGVATQSGEACQGWMQLELPHGTRIQQLVVHGIHGAGSIGTLMVHLYRYAINPAGTAETDRVELALVSLRDAPERFSVAQLAQVATASTSENERLLRVDNANFKYILLANLRAQTTANVELRAFQVICTRS